MFSNENPDNDYYLYSESSMAVAVGLTVTIIIILVVIAIVVWKSFCSIFSYKFVFPKQYERAMFELTVVEELKTLTQYNP